MNMISLCARLAYKCCMLYRDSKRLYSIDVQFAPEYMASHMRNLC